MLETYVLRSPEPSARLPLVFDSPHSGCLFPADFESQADSAQLATGCDLFVEDLWSCVPNIGGHLLYALYSRMYLDLNRSPDDIDPLLLDSGSEMVKPTPYSQRGMGLIRRLALPGVPVYRFPLTLDEVQHRIADYHRPYHDCLSSTLDDLFAEYGQVWHINCHSMKSIGNGMNIDSGILRPDVVLGDCDGLCAGSEFVDAVEQSFVELGYTVARNTPYKGGYLVRHYGNKQRRRHSMQIELNRALYMDENSFERNENYQNLKNKLNIVAKTIAQFVNGSIDS